MYKVIRGKRFSTGEADGPDMVRIVDQSRDDQEVFAFDADSLFVLNGDPRRLSSVSDEDLVRELVKRGRLP
jgi:hypothetical protein